MRPQLKAQIHSASGRSSKILKDGGQIEAVVEVPGRGSFVLCVDAGGGYSLRAYPEGEEDAASQDLLAVGVMNAAEVVAVWPETLSAIGSR